MPIITTPVRLDDVRVNLVQTFHLQNLKDPSRSEAISKTIQLWSMIEHESPAILREGNDFQLSREFRLPNDDVVRPSTPEPSITGIRVSHQLQVAIRYTPLSMNQKLEIKATIDATISSCCAMFAALQLPSYAQPRREILKQFKMHESCESCLVSTSIFPLHRNCLLVHASVSRCGSMRAGEIFHSGRRSEESPHARPSWSVLEVRRRL